MNTAITRPAIRAAAILAAALLLATLTPGTSRAESPPHETPTGLGSQETTLHNAGPSLNATILSPLDGARRHPAIVLVQGAGPGARGQYRTEAEAMARAGFVVLSYDKRTVGYSQTQRSYRLLADDALAAVQTLRTSPGVDPDRVGLWGFSEGGWVAPLAAAQSPDVKFLVLVGASGVSPARAQAWYLTNKLRRTGVRGSMLGPIAQSGTRLMADAGLFPEADHDAAGALARLQQPVLALWGGQDHQEPPLESSRILQDALRQAGNNRSTIHFFPDAEHKLHTTTDGFDRGADLTPGYVPLMARWVADLPDVAPSADTGTPPRQDFASPELAPAPWYRTYGVQLALLLVLLTSFTTYPLVALLRRLRGRRTAPPAALSARLLSATGAVATLGFTLYLLYVQATMDAGPVIAGRAVVWLTLQLLAGVTVAATIATAAQWWRSTSQATALLRIRLGLLVTGGLAFLPWAASWGLLTP
ncbi:alpha/beta fold hydrolase [Kitasatospora sp. NPDC096128]|uniref:alpha/beta hydrolase family protein n=1 Tax=Kitasatospora sp. NPDC096128 TaxID=3155547 RepID=UPI0033275357